MIINLLILQPQGLLTIFSHSFASNWYTIQLCHPPNYNKNHQITKDSQIKEDLEWESNAKKRIVHSCQMKFVYENEEVCENKSRFALQWSLCYHLVMSVTAILSWWHLFNSCKKENGATSIFQSTFSTLSIDRII